MTDGYDVTRRRFLIDLSALCEKYGVDLGTCGCDAGLKVYCRPTEEAHRPEVLLYHVEVDAKGARGNPRYYGETELDVEVEAQRG